LQRQDGTKKRSIFLAKLNNSGVLAFLLNETYRSLMRGNCHRPSSDGFLILLLSYCIQPERLFFMAGGKTRYCRVFELDSFWRKCISLRGRFTALLQFVEIALFSLNASDDFFSLS